MSIQAAIDAWITEHHPKVIRGTTKVVTKQNKAGKVVKTQTTEADPLHAFLLENVQNGTLELLSTGRIVFPLTHHESMCDLNALQSHMNGKAYKRAQVKKYNDDIEWEIYEPHISPHKSLPNMLYCTLTSRHLNKNRAEIEAHINGAAYQRSLAMYEELKAKEAAKRQKLREQRAARRNLLNKTFNTPGASEDKYDFSSVDFGSFIGGFDDGEGEDGFEGDDMFGGFGGEGEFDGDMFDFGEGEFDFDEDLEMEEVDDDDDDDDDDDEEIEEPKIIVTKNAKKIVEKVAAPKKIEVLDLSKKSTKTAPTVVTPAPIQPVKGKKQPPPPPMVESSEEEEEEEEMIDEDDYEFFGDEDDEEDDSGLEWMRDGEGELVPGLYDGEGEFIPGMFTQNGHFLPFGVMENMMNGEGEFDSESFFAGDDEDDDEDDYDIDVFGSDGELDGEGDGDDDEDDDDFIDDDDSDEELGIDNSSMLSNFAKLRQQQEQKAQKVSAQNKAKLLPPPPPVVQNKKNSKQTPAPPPPAPVQQGKRKAQEQIQPKKGNAPTPTKSAQQGKQQQKVQLSPAPPKGKQQQQQQQQQQKKGGRK
jgi:hypothetical protein